MVGGKRDKKITRLQDAAIFASLSAQNGKEAVQGLYRAQIHTEKGAQFSGSVDIDAHFRTTEAQSPRWDYGIGVQISDGREMVFWVEPHPASSTGEVQKMLDKLVWLKAKLDTPAFEKLKSMTASTTEFGSPFYWLLTARGDCRILTGSKEARLLVKNGLRMPARQAILPSARRS